MKQIDYYFWINSDWAYLGADRLEAIASECGASINYMPVDLPAVYARTGGILLGKRAPERQAYRVIELNRWTQKLGIPVNVTPKYMCPNGDLASCLVIAEKFNDGKPGVLAKAILHAEWVLDQDISNPDTLRLIARDLGLDAEALIERAAQANVRAEYAKYTEAAITTGVFGSPSYVFNGELFWGQDRLDFLEEALKVSR
jgi:2-hydroxychromene-2-carboxylate isomerase